MLKEQQINSREELLTTLSDISMVNTALDFQWKFEIETCCKGWFVNVAFNRPDTNTGEMGTGRGRQEYISKGSYESSVIKTAWLLIELVVRHELMEAFRWRGVRIFDPHNSVYQLASIQEKKDGI